jgi:glycosyltransferase involved in cell wall biosynthesis
VSKSVSIIIRSYNEEEHITRLLKGIFEQSVKNIEVIIVDSGSTDQTLKIAETFPVIVHEIKPSEFSFGRALNLGCQAAIGEFFVMASAHIYPVYKDWLKKLLILFDDPKVGAVYGKQRGCDTTKYSEHQIFSKWFPDEGNFSQEHPFFNNANAAIRSKLWKRIPYDETLTGLEDIDWANRVLRLAYKVAYSEEAEVIHVHNETITQVFNRYRREAIALKRIFPQEKFSFSDFLRLFVINSISDIYHSLHDAVFCKNLADIIGFRMMQFWGTYMGYTRRAPITNQLRQRFYYPNGLSRKVSQLKPPELRQRIEYACNRPNGQTKTYN